MIMIKLRLVRHLRILKTTRLLIDMVSRPRQLSRFLKRTLTIRAKKFKSSK